MLRLDALMMDTIRSLERKDFKGVDLTKFVLAILVVAGHTHPFKEITNPIFVHLWERLLLLVVPYFFIAAGFFLFPKVYSSPDKTSRLQALWLYLKRIISLYIYWTIIFLPLTLWHFSHDNLIIEKDVVLFIRGTFFFGENFYSWPLWFLLSMIYSLTFISLLMFINLRVRTIFYISILIFAVAMIFNYLVAGESRNEFLLMLGKIIKYLFLTGRLFTGMFYLMIGGLIAMNQIRISKLAMVLMVLIALTFQFVEIEIISPFLFSLLPITLFCLTVDLKLEGIKNGLFLRKCSTVMYFTHMIIFFLYTLIFRTIPYFGWDAFLVSVAVPMILTPIIIRNEERFPFLKQLFG